VRLGYLGPPGTFSEEALLASAAGVPDAEPVPLATVHDTVMAVAGGTVDRGLVPIENSLEGAVSATLDAIVHDAASVAIVGETVLAVRQCLIARAPVALDELEVVVSHPQGLAQCSRFLRERLPRAQARAATSTAEAVRTVAAAGEPWAAIGTRLAARLYAAEVLEEGIDDDPRNATRFVWLAPAGAPPFPPGDGARGWKTSIVFAGAGDRSPGWLVRCLSEFAFRGVNLTKIESRPARARLGHYLFLVDLDGAADESRVQEAIEGLRAHCEQVRVLGSYPAASDAA
jgi:prephenate dehydratase